MENDNVESVDCYHIDDIDQFQNDLTFKNIIDMTIGGGHRGRVNNVWTYYGEMDYSYQENFNLYNRDGSVIEPISNLEPSKETTILNTNDWVVTLVEKVKWDENTENVERNLSLYIYCPTNAEDIFDEDEIYKQLRNEGY